MPATRRIASIELVFEENGVVLQVNAKTVITATESGLSSTSKRTYGVLYSELDIAGKARLDAVVTQMQSFISTQEPIV